MIKSCPKLSGGGNRLRILLLRTLASQRAQQDGRGKKRRQIRELGNLSNDEGDGNENAPKQ